MNYSVYRKNKKLLESAKRTFGDDLVVNAWVSTWCEENNSYGTEEEAKRRLSNIEKYDFSDFEFEGEPIVLEFVNGRKIGFSSNENGWCDLYVDNVELKEL